MYRKTMDAFEKAMNNPNDPAVIRARAVMAWQLKQYREKNPCPKCGSHNVDIELNCISGPHMSGSEWCNDCGWKKETTA